MLAYIFTSIMNSGQASVKLSFDRTKSELLSVKIRISYKREQRRFALPIKKGVLISEADFERLNRYHENGNKRISEEIRLLHGKIEPYLTKAERIVEDLRPFTFEAFKEVFYGNDEEAKVVDTDNVIEALEAKAALMKQQGRVANGMKYGGVAKSLSRFIASFGNDELKEFFDISNAKKTQVPPILRFANVTPRFLITYEQWMLSHGKESRAKEDKSTKPASLTTVGINCRHLRAVFNDAVSEGLISQDAYPFGRKRYVIPAGSSTKKALSKEDVQKIINFKCEPDSFEERGRDLWIFSYLSNGMNFADILQIRCRDLDKDGNQILFVREKTKRTKKSDQKKIRISLFPLSWAIINRWGNPQGKPDDYLFPFLKASMDPNTMLQTRQQVIRVTNDHMRAIAEKLEIAGNVCTYAARHSFATILLRSEAPIAFISQALGHSNIGTTETYLGSFDDENTKKYLSALL